MPSRSRARSLDRLERPADNREVRSSNLRGPTSPRLAGRGSGSSPRPAVLRHVFPFNSLLEQFADCDALDRVFPICHLPNQEGIVNAFRDVGESATYVVLARGKPNEASLT